MMRRNEFFSLVVVAILFILLLAFSQRDSNYHRPVQYRQVVLDEPKQEDNSTTLKEIIEQQRYEIRHELIDYKFKSGTNLRNYTLETNGDPIRNIIITTWRSGSTFLGDVMNAVPGNYYHYEPLLHYGIVQIRGAPQSDSALKTLKNLLNCNYTTLSRYLNYGRSHPYLFTHNTRLWNLCEMYPRYCWNAGFLNQVCKLFPFQSMKTVRLRLWLAEDLLNDKK